MTSFASSIGLDCRDTFTKKEIEEAREEDAKKDIKSVVRVKDYFQKIG
jgi:hypothetical protein